ncbi:membrane protein [Clostridium carboxidivorans P7]|uniref:histidine kinase n=1 Tax=Clostridium carboxidivorans P7 TaxID=536227 RepID=C6PMM9_9CLOT|nr:sensor histidine kinase [Clostridium carboxidivorans]AKN29900.1 membrane protein [Clostridium carboxidivorans P7]EET89428.1 histidine kinase [Clostridium carboxidivorans P7]
MKKKSFLQIVLWYIRGHKKTIIMGSIFIGIFAGVFSLYSLELEPVLYASFLSSITAFIFITYDFIKYYKKHNELCILEKKINIGLDKLPAANNLVEADYQNILQTLYNQSTELISKMDIKQTEMIDYYTLWAHQIKTPIAAMRLILQSEYTEQNKELLEQVFKIEQYVEMVLGYLKIDNNSSDLVLKSYNLLQIIKQVIRKYAHVFIRKNIVLNLKEMDCIVLTDEKWLVFVIEQILWNALKYTSSGKISIYMEDTSKKVLVIEDTGAGIAEEDLPRVFERGFTGYNGRMDKKATGIGLYLCKKILDKLSHTINITSKVNVGTKVKINLSSVKTIIE